MGIQSDCGMSERVIQYPVAQVEKVQRADKLFADHFDSISRSRLQRAFEAGRVTFNGQVIDKRFKIQQPGLLEATLEEVAADACPEPVAIPLDVVYEDASILVINKAAGMVTHPGNGTGNDTVVHAALYHCQQQGQQLSSVGAPLRPGIVHRLDKETSGLMVVAKTDAAHHKLVQAFSERETYKRYCALVAAQPSTAQGSIREPIGRHPVVRTRMATVPAGKPAHTDWSLVQRLGSQAAQISCVIHTGRTHQIRVHMAALKMPLLGDSNYGFRSARFRGISIPRVMLHACELAFAHPADGRPLRFEAALPEDFEVTMQQLKPGAS